MVFSKVFGPLFAIVLATAVVNASPVATPEANALSGIAKRTCAQTYTVVAGDTCSAIESKTGLCDAQLRQLNPEINSDCTNLQVGQILCVSGGTSCSQIYAVVSGDTCSAIESKTGLSDAQLHQLNPGINSGCTNLQVNQTLCIRGETSGDGCPQTYTVVSGDNCWTIELKTGLSDAQLHQLNPEINSVCTNLQVGQTVCVSAGTCGSGGTTLGPFNGLATYYDPNGGTGACPPYPVINNGDMAVAIGSGHWDGGAHCGKTMTVTYGSTTISVIVKDLCPGCQGPNGIDLTEGAMAAMDPDYVNHGVDSVQWSI